MTARRSLPRISRAGATLACVFLGVYALSLHWVAQGHSQSIFLVWLVTFPFSLGLHALAGAMQDAVALSDQARAALEAVLLGAFGTIEFYALGALVSRSLARL